MDGGTNLSRYEVAWYYESNNTNVPLATDSLYLECQRKYEQYRPVGIAFKFFPNTPNDGRTIDLQWVVHDANTNLNTNPLTFE